MTTLAGELDNVLRWVVSQQVSDGTIGFGSEVGIASPIPEALSTPTRQAISEELKGANRK